MKLPLTITKDGLSALVDAGAGRTNSVHIASVGLTATPFTMAPTLTALPGEHTRIDTVSGKSVSENVLHMVASDNSENTYTVTGIGLFTDTGDLFGVFSLAAGDDALFEKAAAATFLFAADITFEAGEAALIDFGDTNFLNPPATEAQKGVAYLATAAEVAAGVDAEKIVTPAALASNFIPLAQRGVANGVASLDATGRVPPSQLPAMDSIDTFTVDTQAQMLALPAGPGDFALRTDLNKTFILRSAPATTLANWAEFLSPGAPVRTVNGHIGDVVLTPADVGAVPATRHVDGGGLVTGGGDLSADRVLSVLIATAAEVMAGTENGKAVTPASLATLLAALAGKIPASRLINAGGLASGGGDLSADRTITVPKATSADVEGLLDDTKALTAKALAGTLRNIAYSGYLRIPGTPLIIQWGQGSYNSRGNTVLNFYFPVAFPNACFYASAQPYSVYDDGDSADEAMFISNRVREYFSYSSYAMDLTPFSFGFFAIGY